MDGVYFRLYEGGVQTASGNFGRESQMGIGRRRTTRQP